MFGLHRLWLLGLCCVEFNLGFAKSGFKDLGTDLEDC